jgi:hypothetical protein
MNRKAKTGLVVFGVGLLAAPFQAWAETTTTPAPAGSSEAVAAQVGDLIEVGYTQATADQNKGEATATALGIGGEPLGDATGGTQKGAGSSEGGIFDSGDTPLGRLMVTPWKATVTQTADKRTADSDAALVRLILIDSSTASADVLRTRSHAEHNGMESKGSTSSDGVWANVGGEEGLTVVLLHSETSSSAKGNSSYVAGINDNKILSSDEAGNSCAVEVPGVITLGCLAASGGKGASAASVADGHLGDPDGPRLAVSAGASKYGQGEVGPSVLGTEFDRPEVAAAGGDGTGFAVTGSDTLFGGMVGLALLCLGAAFLALRRAWGFAA